MRWHGDMCEVRISGVGARFRRVRCDSLEICYCLLQGVHIKREDDTGCVGWLEGRRLWARAETGDGRRWRERGVND